jgi:glucans biosynthesis protein
MIDRRGFMALGIPWAALLAASAGGCAVRNEPGTAAAAVALGPPLPFGFERLRQRAEALAKSEYVARPKPAAEIVRSIYFDTAQKIKYRPHYTLWNDGPVPVRLFHLHHYVPEPVKIHMVTGQTAREATYSSRYFDYGDTGLESRLPGDLGFAGFRIMDAPGRPTDWLAFQGASYFRSSGAEDQYGASARGIAVDTGLSRPEEFPSFIEFWLDESAGDDLAITIYALLDGPSLAGAYRFRAAKRDGATIDVHAALFFRKDVERLGVAPLTSMYWYGENDRRRANDWRPEIHDSDGLALWTGSGERIFRPLANPPSLQVNAFVDDNPKGFGLMQRDRDFDHYQDDGAFYERRPSIWVEPLGGWGKGAVTLIELPTDDEVYDNIVAFWQPQTPPRKGETRVFDYRMHWRNRAPHPPKNVGQVVATRIGRAGAPGRPRSGSAMGRKFVIDFEGGPLADMAPRFDITPVVSASRGRIDNGYVIRIVGTNRWRAAFDLHADGREPIGLRTYLRLGEQTLSETWLYQYFPSL